MLIYKINFSLLTYLYFCGRGLKGRAGCRQTEVLTRQTKNRQGVGSANSGAYYISGLTYA